MKKFKQYLSENIVSAEVSAPETAIADQNSLAPQVNFISPKQYNPQATAPTSKKPATQPRQDEGQEEKPEEERPERKPDSWEEWIKNNPFPREGDYDSNGDGVLDEEEREAYNDAIERWRFWYEQWLYDWQDYYWRQREPVIPEDGPFTPMEWDYDIDRWWRERPRVPGIEDDDRIKPDPDDRFSKEAYEYWRRIFFETYGSDPILRELFDWWWEWKKTGTMPALPPGLIPKS